MRAVGVTDGFKAVGSHQGSAVMDRLTDEVRRGSLWTMIVDNTVISESRKQVEKSLERMDESQ